MNLTIFGTGYVGLVTGACFAESGNNVCCVDVDAAKIEGLRNGIVPIYEPGLAELVEQNSAVGRLTFTTDAAEGLAHGQLIFIAVGTPPREDGSTDLRYVETVARTIGQHLDHAAIIVDKSTVPVGTADRVREIIAEEMEKRGVHVPFDVVSNPEFLKEGAAIEDFLRPDRIVIGGGIVAAGEAVLEPIRRHLRERVTLVPPDEIQVVAAQLGPKAGAVGAALAPLAAQAVRAR